MIYCVIEQVISLINRFYEFHRLAVGEIITKDNRTSIFLNFLQLFIFFKILFINDDEFSRRPPVSASVLIHVIGKIGEDVIREQGVIAEDHCFFRVVPRIDPACVGRDDLVEEGLIAIGRDPDSVELLRNDSAVSILAPFESRALLGGLGLGLLTRLHIVHGFPRAAQSRRWVVDLRGDLAVLDAQLLDLGDEVGVLAIEVVVDHV